MRKLIISALLISVTIFSNSCKEDESAPLTMGQKYDLQFLREEEKLARDVYLYSYELYGEEIFNTISNSEQIHMDKVLELLIKYNI